MEHNYEYEIREEIFLSMFKARWIKLSLLAVGLVAAALLLGGYPPILNRQVETTTGGIPNPPLQAAGEEKKEVVLYFSDEQAMYLAPEKRQVTVEEASIEETVVKELIKGPESPLLKRTLPEQTRLLSLSVEQETAYVDFSKEINNINYGGSAGEIALIYSVVNSLGEVPGIKRVQFLVEGKKVETLYGHIDTENPIEPDQKLVKG